jgi:hypothetical protein
MVAPQLRDHKGAQQAEQSDGQPTALEQNWQQYHELYSQVRNLPRSEKINLLHLMLDELLQEQELSSPPRATLTQALGRMKRNGPAPSDDEVHQILINELAERYG